MSGWIVNGWINGWSMDGSMDGWIVDTRVSLIFLQKEDKVPECSNVLHGEALHIFSEFLIFIDPNSVFVKEIFISKCSTK